MCSGWHWHRKCLSELISFGPERNVSASLVHPSVNILGTLMHQGHENIMQQEPVLSSSFNLNTNDRSSIIFKLIMMKACCKRPDEGGHKRSDNAPDHKCSPQCWICPQCSRGAV